MSERITDERLAEIEHRWTNDGWILDSDGFAIIEALKAERAEVARLREARELSQGLNAISYAEARTAEAKLRAVGEFPNVLRARSEEYTSLSETGRALDAAADELEALLK